MLILWEKWAQRGAKRASQDPRRGIPRVVGSLPYYPGGIPRWYIRLPMPPRVCTLCVQCSLRDHRSGPLTVINSLSKRQGFSPRKGGFLTSGINLRPRGNLPIKAKKPGTESRFAQGGREYQEVSATVLKPP